MAESRDPASCALPPSPVTRGSGRTRSGGLSRISRLWMEERPGSFTLRAGSAVLGFIAGENYGFDAYLSDRLDLFPPFLLSLYLDQELGALCNGGVTRPRKLYSPAVSSQERKQEDAEPSDDDDALLTEREAGDVAVSDSRAAQRSSVLVIIVFGGFYHVYVVRPWSSSFLLHTFYFGVRLWEKLGFRLVMF
ncbi:unnamed protein product [Musa acuminata subsp. malaccensis]|uniref:(wild Malaysian banana) hypothetical protein n=1 Tax=Musa acuminata subsp. malaccensis TaxID=214687 RepID=A0A804JG32_MUSAM|nr:unnamed protein product [Musa acuminata subsp. malaccensis]